MDALKRDQKIDIVELLKDLDKYEPRRRGWTWREKAEDQHMGPFEFHEISKPLKKSVPLPPARFMEDIDPQPMQTITTEIASILSRTRSLQRKSLPEDSKTISEE